MLELFRQKKEPNYSLKEITTKLEYQNMELEEPKINYIKLTLEQKAKFMDLYVGDGLSIKDAAIIIGVSYASGLNIVDKYFKKPEKDLLLQSKIND